ncbi:hypothetical protein F66182_6029 [Fusarium sp. NRRL 66182]|nr:hypothetical protein F66182_6029 [Fusarium sp. NRRL 66182]
MALEHANTKFSLHELGKDMVLGTSCPNDPNGNPYKLAIVPEYAPKIPDPGIFTFKEPNGSIPTNPTVPDLALPTLSECAAHLEFLETLYVLRQTILVSKDFDEAMCIKPARETKTGVRGDTKTFKDDNLWERRQQKWPKYIEFAVVRFLAWRDGLSQLNHADVTNNTLPPLDVLMVWHAFLLNPRLFRKQCSKEALFSIKFPWRRIHDAVNNHDWVFTLPPSAAAHYEEAFEVSSDLLKEISSLGSLSYTAKAWLGGLGLQSSCDRTAAMGGLQGFYSQLFDRCDTDLGILLRDAVIRQTSFIDKMNTHMWIRSPALQGTVRRGIERYLNFCKLVKVSKSTVVPTLDIDLVWHTHQCTAKHYGKAIKVLSGKFVNHDDTIDKPKLGDGFGETRRLYRVHFGQEYRICGCWDCQALLTELEKAQVWEEEIFDMDKIAAKVKEEVFYHRAVEWSRRHKATLPMRRN